MHTRWRHLARRFGHMLLVLWVIVTLLFLIFRLMPGNPLVAYIDPTWTEEQQVALLQQFGLDKPLWMQYFIYLGNLLKGELGTSFFFRRPVMEIIGGILPNSLYLMGASLLMAYSVGVMGGMLLAWKRGTKLEKLGIIVTLFTRAAPQFWVGMVVLAIFAFKLQWFPSSGASSPGTVYASEWAKLISLDFWHHLFLPSMTLAVYLLGLPLLLMRSNMMDVMGEAYVDMARMRGLGELRVMLKYAARNAALPVVTAMALGIGYALGGNVIIETVFSWPGLGRLLVKSVASSDYPLAQGAFLLIATLMVSMNFLADILYSYLDPRVSLDGRR